MTNMLRRINIAAVLVLYASMACDSGAAVTTLPLPSEPESAARPEPTDAAFEPPPCVPSSLGFEFDDDNAAVVDNDPRWERTLWLQLHTADSQQTRYQTTGSQWQSSTHTSTSSLIRWELGVESSSRSGEPAQIELNVHSVSAEPAAALHTLRGLPVEGLSLTCRPNPQGLWVCRGRGDEGQLGPWPSGLPNPLQLMALQKRPGAAEDTGFILDGVRLPQNAQTRVRTGALAGSSSTLISWSGERTIETAWEADAASVASGHLAFSTISGRGFQMSACTGEQASGQADAAGELVRWSVNQSTQTTTVGYATTESRAAAE